MADKNNSSELVECSRCVHKIKNTKGCNICGAMLMQYKCEMPTYDDPVECTLFRYDLTSYIHIQSENVDNEGRSYVIEGRDNKGKYILSLYMHSHSNVFDCIFYGKGAKQKASKLYKDIVQWINSNDEFIRDKLREYKA